MTFLSSRRALIAAAATAVPAVLALLALALFPYGLLRGVAERRLSARLGRPVTIARLDRVDTIGFHPLLAVRGLTIPQPGWAGPGDFVRLAQGQARLSAWALLIGRLSPSDIRLKGLRLALVRRADGVGNADAGSGGSAGSWGGSEARDLAGLTVVDGEVIYRDALRARQLVARVAIDPVRGVKIDGDGMVMGTPVTVALRGPATTATGKPWPFVATLDGAALAMSARGTMDRPLDLAHLSFAATARARDLRLVDAVIEAGLFGTQPVEFTARVRRDRPDWTITGLTGSVGRSDIAGDVTVTTRADRRRVTGRLVSRRFAFDDLASSEQLAKAAAARLRGGAKLVPDLPVNLANLASTDGRLDVRIDRIVSYDAPTSLKALRGTLTLDHQRLTVDPFALDLTTGAITGRATVAQNGAAVPTVTLDLTLAHSDITTLAGGGGSVTGSVAARARLTGRGARLRDAVGDSDGSIGFVARDGILPARVAAELGFDAGRAFFASEDDEAGLRCVVIRLAVRRGHGTLDPPLIVDTSQSQLVGKGSVDFPAEALAIGLTGAPKHGSLLRLPGSASIAGTIREPRVVVAPEVKSIGNVLKAIGRAITGNDAPVATDADCAALSAAALR